MDHALACTQACQTWISAVAIVSNSHLATVIVCGYTLTPFIKDHSPCSDRIRCCFGRELYISYYVPSYDYCYCVQYIYGMEMGLGHHWVRTLCLHVFGWASTQSVTQERNTGLTRVVAGAGTSLSLLLLQLDRKYC